MKIVYKLVDPLTNLPFYVGKGSADRPYQHVRLVKSGKSTASKRLTFFLKKMIRDGREPNVEIVQSNLTNDEARIIETQLIIQHGRIDHEETGILLNHMLSQNDWAGKHHTEESKRKISESHRGKNLSAEHIQKVRTSNLGKKHPERSDEWRAKQRASHLGRKDSPQALVNKSIAHTGASNPRAKTWTVHREDGTTFQIKALKTWCRENNLSFDSLCRTKKTGQFYQGLKVSLSGVQLPR